MKLVEFIELLQRHDWYYQYSDDHRVWQRGQSQWNRIRAIREENKADLNFEKAFNRECPWID